MTVPDWRTMEKLEIEIDAQKREQKWEGFGTSLMWWANAFKGFDEIPATAWGKANGCQNRYDELMALLFDPKNGLGINIVRYNVGGGDCEELDFINRSGAKIPGYLDAGGQYHWTADWMQQKVLKDAYRMIQTTDQRFYNTVFSVAPPYFMTYSGSSTGNKIATDDNLRWDRYADFVTYFLDAAGYIQDVLKIPVTDLEPVNEPTSGYWVYGSQKQEGCQFNRTVQPEIHRAYFNRETDSYNPEEYSALSKIYEITGRELARRQRDGKLSGTTICGTDETSIDEAVLSFQALTKDAKQYISKIATHGYGGSLRAELQKIASEYGKALWMSEACYGGGRWNPEAMDSGCFSLSSAIRKDLYELKATGWVIWQGLESLGSNLLWDSNWGLIHCLYEEPAWKEEHPFGMSRKEYDLDAAHRLTPEAFLARGLRRGDYFPARQYYVFGQYTRFLREGCEIVDVSDQSFVAAVSPQGNLVVVAANDTPDEKIYCAKIKNCGNILSVLGTRTSDTEKWAKVEELPKCGPDWVEFRLPPRSVSTYEIMAELN